MRRLVWTVACAMGICGAASTASAQGVKAVTGASCPAGWEHATVAWAKANAGKACRAPGMGQWHILYLANGGSFSGPGYKCSVIERDTRKLGGSLCARYSSSPGTVAKPAPKPAVSAPSTGTVDATITPPKGWTRLKTQFRGEGECFEGNQRTSQVSGGGAFMDRCQNVSGQLWKLVPAGNGYFRMKTQFRGEGECLEGNQRTSKTHKGAAFMDRCQNVSGQLWKFAR